MIRIIALILAAGAGYAGFNGDPPEEPAEEPADMLPYEDLRGPGRVELGLADLGIIDDFPTPPPTPMKVGLDPYTPDYEERFEEAYAEPLAELRDYRVKVRRRIGIVQPEYMPPPMPREAGGDRPGRVTR